MGGIPGVHHFGDVRQKQSVSNNITKLTIFFQIGKAKRLTGLQKYWSCIYVKNKTQ